MNTNINFCFCLPSTELEYVTTQYSEVHDFTKHFNRVRAKNGEANFSFYEREICKPYQYLKKTFQPLGINFFDSCSLASLQQLFNNDEAVIILFSHCLNGGCQEKEKVEFSDRLYGWKEILTIVPNHFKGVIDLAVCKPKILANQLKIQRGECVVKSSTVSLQIIYWLYFYCELFRNIILKDLDYIDALTFTFIDLKNKYEPKTAQVS